MSDAILVADEVQPVAAPTGSKDSLHLTAGKQPGTGSIVAAQQRMGDAQGGSMTPSAGGAYAQMAETAPDQRSDAEEARQVYDSGASRWSRAGLVSHAKQRLREERHLLVRQWPYLALCLFILGYGGMMVFRNLAYYRLPKPPEGAIVGQAMEHCPTGGRLRDLGHDIFPELKGEANIKKADIPMHCFYAILAGTLAGLMLPPREGYPEKPHIVSALRFIFTVYSTGHCLRACTYIGTSVPGSSADCLFPPYGNGTYDAPPTLGSCFYRLVSFNGNCGDLIFSGHMLLMWMGTLMVARYAHVSWSLPGGKFGKAHIAAVSLAALISIIQACCILAARHHYTVDLVVSSYTTPLLWHFIDSAVVKSDMRPDNALLEHELAEERALPRWKRNVRLAAWVLLFGTVGLGVYIIFRGNFKIFQK